LKNKKIENILINNILPYVSKPGRYIGNELNIVRKGDKNVSVRIALAFPEVYEIGMSYIGFEILYNILNQKKGVWAERVYMPWSDMEERMREEGIPLYSLESFTPLQQFDIIGFTLQYELTYTNILSILDLAGIPVCSNQRKENDPIIIGGGPCSCNPEPMSPFFDVFLIGDGEEAFVEISDIFSQQKELEYSRSEILEKLAQIRGVYVPSFYEAIYDDLGIFAGLVPTANDIPSTVLTRIVTKLEPNNYPDKPIVPLLEVTHDRLALEVMRGCSEGCRYCNAGMIYRPVRERSPEEIVKQSEKGIQNSGYDEVSFLSLSISDYSELNDLMNAEKESLEGKYINVSLPSMRLDSFSDDIAKFVSTVRKSGFTFAPEAGSERLRRVINKNITEQNLLESVDIALRNGWKLLKFYFMIGLPTEKEEDVESIADLFEKVVGLSRKFGRINFTISISPFSPKAHTPFQWEKQDTRESLIKKVDILRQRLRRFKQIRLNWRDPEVSALECALGRGDRRMGKAIYLAWQHGASMDGWTENFDFNRWRTAIQDAGLSLDKVLGDFELDSPLPWDHIDKGITKKFLLKERHKAYSEEPTIDCKDGLCHACGIQRKGGFSELAECYSEQDSQNQSNERKIPNLNNNSEDSEDKGQPKTIRKFRLQYNKLGYARYISHLDLIRVFDRAFRRADIPLRYSEGFNPHPKFSFAPPLALGYTSESEFVDIEIHNELNLVAVENLNASLPEGLKIISFKEVEISTTSLNDAIQFAEYEIDLSNSKVGEIEFQKSLESFLNIEEIVVQRKTKGKFKPVNIRPYVRSVSRENNILQIETKTIDRRTVRINEILENLFQHQNKKEIPVRIHRKRQLVSVNGAKLTPFDVV